MAQFARPTLDKSRDNWFDETLTIIADLYTRVNEAIANDATYIQSALSPTNDTMVLQLSYLIDPVVNTGHIVRYRYRKDQDTGDTISLTVQLIQGYINEMNLGTLISQKVQSDIGGTAWIAGTFILTDAEALTITNYGDLFIRFIANKS